MSIQSELLAIKAATSNPEGLLVVEEVHEWAENHKDSAIGKSLEWDDREAGYQYRLGQIRRLVQLHLIRSDEKPRVLSLSSDRTNGTGGGYRDMEEILSRKDLFETALADALRELERVQARYDSLKQLEPVWKAVAEVRSRYGRRKRRGGEERATA